MYHFIIEFMNSYGHVINSFYYDCKTEKAAIAKAKKEKGIMYPDCSWIEIINLDTKKRIYA